MLRTGSRMLRKPGGDFSHPSAARVDGRARPNTLRWMGSPGVQRSDALSEGSFSARARPDVAKTARRSLRGEFYDARAHATSVSHGRSSPRRLSRSARAYAACGRVRDCDSRPLPSYPKSSGVRHHQTRCQLEFPLGAWWAIRDDLWISIVVKCFCHAGHPATPRLGDAPAFLAREQGGSLAGDRFLRRGRLARR
jgi:hypothetical protein